MSLVAEPERSEDVNDFLLRIRELGDRRDKEDEERTRKLEEDLIQSRKERQARREGQSKMTLSHCREMMMMNLMANTTLERARSLSPTKGSSSNTGTPNSTRSTMDTSVDHEPSNSSDYRILETRDQGLDNDSRITNREPSNPKSEPITLSNTSSNSALPLARSGTLSWQQRPTSRGSTSGVRSRPLSMVATHNNATSSPRACPDPTPTSGSAVSRAQIAQSLGSKDPSWFKQTEDRAAGSAGNRRNIGEEVPNVAAQSTNVRLPGLSREASAGVERELSPLPESIRPSSTSREGSIGGISATDQRYLNPATISSAIGLRSLLPSLSGQRFEPPYSDTDSPSDTDAPVASRTLAMSPAQGRISPERFDRPASPTKGLGGFVQSAMLKRSDSVNKRWSAQPGAGLSRGNSITSNRSRYDGSRPNLGNMNSYREIRPGNLSSDSSPTSKSRPGSNHDKIPVSHPQADNDGLSTSFMLEDNKSESASDSKFTKPALPFQKNPITGSEARENNRDTEFLEKTPTLSPNKRWSPTKASWLENAINKPESPRTAAPPPQQPSWMAEISRAKQKRGSFDLGKSDTLREPPLVRSSKPPGIGGPPNGLRAGIAKQSQAGTSDFETPESSAVKADVAAKSRDSTTSLPSSKTPTITEERAETNGRTPEKSNAIFPPPIKPKESPIDMRRGTSKPLKPKPETPPKKDFRSNLKSRQVSAGKETNEDAEFKNVFGKLKRTQTKNYVAPDELKDNIMRGKAGLALTGGPKKTERKDEFKESLLKQKEAMKAGASSGTPRKISGNTVGTDDPPVPEALAKKKGLIRSENGMNDVSAAVGKTLGKPEVIDKGERLHDKFKPLPLSTKLGIPTNVQNERAVQSKVENSFSGSLATLISRGPSPVAAGSKASVAMNPSSMSDFKSSTLDETDEATAIGPQLTHMTKARAKGPKRRLPKNIIENVSARPSASVSSPGPTESSPRTISPGSQSRADPYSAPTIAEKLDTRPLVSISNNGNRKASQPNTPRKPSTSIASLDKAKEISPSSPERPPEVIAKASPLMKPKSGILSSNGPSRETLTSTSVSNPVPSIPPTPLKIQRSQATSAEPTVAQENQRVSAVEDEISPPSVRNAAATWEKSPVLSSSRHAHVKSPIKLPTRKDEETAFQDAGLHRKGSKVPVGLGIHVVRNEIEASPPSQHNLPISPAKSPRSPPLPTKKSIIVANRSVFSTPAPKAKPEHLNSSSQQHSEAARLFAEYFSEVPSSNGRVNIDTQAVLASRSSSAASNKIKTLRKQIWEVTGDGKSVEVPSHQEHILFEESMYLCNHVFGNAAGIRTTEVYLWCGDGVPTSAAEDAQLFARKVAKDNNGRLLVLQQGKESPNFFEALGGIVITRRGASSRADRPSSAGAIYMLCGRRHVGQIAFDEVDFDPRSLCSGFPFIVSAQFGKLYLWKGNGSSADELGCARLIGMDLGLTGEIEEIDEGKEPNVFWESFANNKRKDASTSAGDGKAQHWPLKSSCEKYTTRLFSVDLETPKSKFGSGFSWARRGSGPSSEEGATPTTQIREINPFTCSDLVDDGVFVLDTFFEIYV